MEDILNLKQEILDIKTENLNSKIQNDHLKNKIVTDAGVAPSKTNQGVTKQPTLTTEATRERCLAISGLNCFT